ncbi:MAG TPA: protocatechuate 3,4-dioxygenase subunit alpha [Candidatus Angelobacter sp.]|jgi:protocatechuate 3,4-dioxygenase alpha subunit|nr:protocatechuate 3,4-dioxygenase subunit alpha [Candidatus Angelobacter sp.]
MDLVPTPSQTVGPFFHLGFAATFDGTIASPDAKGERLRMICRVFDGDGVPVPDAMIELWQANAEGKYPHPDDLQAKSFDPGFRGFGRLATSEDGSCIFETIKPGRVPGDRGTLQAPHINVSVFARGILKRLATRIYFSGDPANHEDFVLALAPADRRDTLMARADTAQPDTWQFDIYLCGEHETVFFDI